MFLLRKQATEIENGVTDGTLLTLYHGMSRTLILWNRQSLCYVTTTKWLTCLLQLMVTWYTGCPAMR